MTDTEDRALDEVAAQTGKTRDEVLREALNQYLGHIYESIRRAPLGKGRGLWRKQEDLPSIETLRGEIDRF